MKIWSGFGTEHSANLVIVGRFKTEEDADAAKALIEQWTDLARKHVPEKGATTFGPEILKFLIDSNIAGWASHDDPRTLIYDYDMQRNGKEVVISTEESDFGAFLKVMLHKGARIETYSAHDYKDTHRGS